MRKPNPNPKNPQRRLTEKQRRFAKEYLVDFNATRAAERAGYDTTPGGLRHMGSVLLSNPLVQAAIAEHRKKLIDSEGVSPEDVVRELKRLAFANMQDYMRVGPDGDPVLDFSGLTRAQAAALVEVTVDRYVEGRGEDARTVKRVKFKLADKLNALVNLGKHLGMFKEKTDITVHGRVEHVQPVFKIDELEGLSAAEREAVRGLLSNRARQPGAGPEGAGPVREPNAGGLH
jgi:phage terminase small subunit